MQSQAVSTDCRRRRLHGWLAGGEGQSTVEFAIVLAAFVCVALGFGALWDALKSGLFVQHALQCASHHLSQAGSGAWADVLAY